MDARLSRVVSETSRFGDLHTKTYDIELLISGAMVFGLLTVPGEMNTVFDRWGARLDGLASQALTYLYVYSQMVAYSMLATFIAHLCLRGYWIALLGLESVWSDGWNWDRLKLGPYSRERLQKRVPSLSQAINAADDRASVIFAAGLLLVMVSLYSVVMVLGAIAAALVIETTTGMPGPRAFFIALGVAFGTAIIIPQLDKRIGPRLDPGTRPGQFFTRLVWLGMFISPLRWTGPVQFVFQSRIGERRLTIAMTVAATILSAGLIAGMLFRAGVLRVDGWTYFDPAPTGASLDPRHYRNSGVEHDGRRPTIDSDVISGPLIRLYLPYRPRRHNPMIAKACPELAATVAKGTAPDNAVGAACLGGLYKVALDGVTVTSTYRFTRDAESDFVGVAAYLPTANLPQGPHELTIDAPGNNENAPREIIKIPFYTAPGSK